MSGKIILDETTKSLFRVLKSLPELNVQILNEGIKFQCSNFATKSRMFQLFLAKNDFIKFKINLGDARFHIISTEATKIVNYIVKAKGNIVFDFNINELTERVELYFYERNWQNGMNYSYPIDIAVSMLIGLDSKPYPSFCSMTTKTWNDTINLLIPFQRDILFHHSSESLQFYTIGEKGEALPDPEKNLRKTIKYGTLRGETLGYEVKPKTKLITVIGLDYLVESLKFIRLLNTVRIDVGHEIPLRIIQKFGLNSSITYIFAPRMNERVKNYS